MLPLRGLFKLGACEQRLSMHHQSVHTLEISGRILPAWLSVPCMVTAYGMCIP